MFSRAKQAEILRSSQKDDYYCGSIKSYLSEIVQKVGGPRIWLKWNNEFEVLADVVYFTLTTFGGFQTLGEEYVNIILVNKTMKALPSKLQRTLMILIQCCVPYIFERGLVYMEKSLDNNVFPELTTKGRDMLKRMISASRHIVLLLHRCNLAVFYIRGIFYHISKRFTNTHYILVRPDPNEQRISNYKILGWLCAVQLFVTFIQQCSVLFNKFKQSSTQKASEDTLAASVNSEQDSSEMSLSSMSKCALCLEQRRNSTVTPCGHLFCWECIHEWCRNKVMCPLCRDEFPLSRLIHLKNYDSF